MPKKGETSRHEGHRSRMRERFSRDGFDNYRPHEVIEQILFECLPRVNTNEIGHDLIDRFGSVMGVLDATVDELCKVEGIGRKSAEYIASIKPTVGRVIEDQYRELGEVNREMAVFLFDWYMREGTTDVGLLVCDSQGVFREFARLHPGTDGNEEEWLLLLADKICETVGEGRYLILLPDGTPKSTAYRLLDMTSAKGSTMVNAFVRRGVSLVSLLFG